MRSTPRATARRTTPFNRLVLELRVELGRVEVGDEGRGEHGHQDQHKRVQSGGSGENRPGVFREAREETSTFHVAKETKKNPHRNITQDCASFEFLRNAFIFSRRCATGGGKKRR